MKFATLLRSSLHFSNILLITVNSPYLDVLYLDISPYLDDLNSPFRFPSMLFSISRYSLYLDHSLCRWSLDNIREQITLHMSMEKSSSLVFPTFEVSDRVLLWIWDKQINIVDPDCF